MNNNSLSMFRKKYGEMEEERFNKDFIYARKNESLEHLIDSICSALEVIPNIKYLGCKIESMRKIYSSNKTPKEIPIEKSKFITIILNFKLTKGEEETIIRKKLLFPKLIDGGYFLINGNRYIPVYQMLDSGTYRTKKSLTLRTLLMNIIIKDIKETLSDTDDNKYDGKVLKLSLFKNDINCFIYYFAKYGLYETINYFKLEDKLIVMQSNSMDYDKEKYIKFNSSKSLSFLVDKESMNKENFRTIIITFLSVFTNRSKLEKIEDQSYWIKKLGSYFTKNNSKQQEKGESILLSFQRIFDDVTRKIIRIDDDEYKKDSFSIVRWMCENFSLLSKQDSMDLANKRLRMYEYLLYPLLIQFSKSTYRILNNRNPTMNQLKTIFSNIQPGFLITKLIKTELIRYKNNVNSFDLFSCLLKGTITGPQSPFKSGKMNNVKFLDIHKSFINKIDLCATATGDPGLSFTLVPFLKLEENLHFSKQPKYELE